MAEIYVKLANGTMQKVHLETDPTQVKGLSDTVKSIKVDEAGNADKLADAKEIKIHDADGNASTAVAFDGSKNVILELPNTIPNQRQLGYRQPSATYEVGNIKYHSALPTGRYLECTTPGTSGNGALTISSPTIGGTVTDGTVTWTVRKMESTEYRSRVIVDSAAAHNAIYRGNDLTAYFNSGEMSAAIADGSFRNIYPGDYITKSITIDGTTYNNVKFIIMDLDPHLHKGDTETTAHHVAIMPEERLGTAQMNANNTTVGGYLGSVMWTTHIPKVVAGFEAAFGAAHILEHRELLSNAMDANLKPSGYNGWSGASSGWTWTSVKVNLANENMVYGAPVVSSSLHDTGEWDNQLAAFRLNPGLICSKRYWWWLRSVAGASRFCCVADGGANYYAAATSLGVRPIALLH